MTVNSPPSEPRPGAETVGSAPPAQSGPDREAGAKGGHDARRVAIMAVIALLVGVAGIAAARPLVGLFSPHIYSGTVLQQSQSAPPLDGLQFASGEPADLSRFEGDVALVFFGYTNCPDVCPMTLSTVSRALDELDDEQRERVNMMMVSVDPDRDDLPFLQEYVGLFDPGFRGVGGPKEAIDRAASLYGVYYELNQVGFNDQSYLVDHTTSLMGIGPDGALRVVWSSDIEADALSADLEALLS